MVLNEYLTEAIVIRTDGADMMFLVTETTAARRKIKRVYEASATRPPHKCSMRGSGYGGGTHHYYFKGVSWAMPSRQGIGLATRH
jgi:hypothetical protein